MSTYLLIGEIHGTKECPKEFLKFVKKNKIKKVALEFLKDYQIEIDKFYYGKRSLEDISFLKNKEKNHDGRASDAVRRLISELRKEKIKIFLVDVETGSGNERDKLMAKNLSKIKGKVAFLCGNVHAMKKPLQLNKSDDLYQHYSVGRVKTCGYFLNKNEKVISIKIHAINGGKFYNYFIQNYPKDKSLSQKFSPNNLPKQIHSEDNAFDFLYLVDKFSYSK